MEAKRVEELAHHSKTQRHSQRTVLDIHVLKKGSFSGLRQVRPLLLLQWVLTCSHSITTPSPATLTCPAKLNKASFLA